VVTVVGKNGGGQTGERIKGGEEGVGVVVPAEYLGPNLWWGGFGGWGRGRK